MLCLQAATISATDSLSKLNIEHTVFVKFCYILLYTVLEDILMHRLLLLSLFFNYVLYTAKH